ncbi:hypothetical protein ACTJJ0_34430 [Chitinophaga sp. 22321]|uniref:Tetratricopeptide repeat-containing protein n=1 Tax=Chitinophaga hostae TaxID=2831022 RepID=A0ABS5JCR6_9BACT|nr:hypothetical protein [Chitinophaga hostae]MBS0032417.1 hypothetical protein [Chitinophaga hostae]
MNFVEQRFLTSVSEDLKILSGTEFEYFCRGILHLILGESKDISSIHHKGHNLYAKPVGYTADFLAEDYNVIGQCGTDKNYFEDRKKPLHDIERIFENHNSCEHIYLFSNQRATGGQLTDLNADIEGLNFTTRVYVYDSEKIAKVLLENIHAALIIDPLLERLPKTFEYYKILPQTNKIPDFKFQYYWRREEQIILNHLETHTYIQIYGLSGIGKTELAIAVTREIQIECELSLWINGDDFNSRKINFSSVQLTRFSNTINLQFLLEKHRVCLVVDNLNEYLEDFIADFNKYNYKDSKCIITSLQKNFDDTSSMLIPFMDKEVARNILLECAVSPSLEQINKILEKSDGYPLVLRLIKSAVEVDDYSWEDIVNELSTIVGLSDETNKKISQRIIGKFTHTWANELGLIKYIDKRLISRHFLVSAILKKGITQLTKRSILSIHDSNFFVIHQLILDSVKHEVNIDNRIMVFDNYLERYLTQYNVSKPLSYYLFIFNHSKFIDDVYQKYGYADNLKKIIFYSLIQRTDLNSNMSFIINEFKKFDLHDSNDCDIYLIVEEGEIELMNIDKRKSWDQYSGKCIEIIDKLIRIKQKSEDEEILCLLNHHIGKAFFFNNNFEEARQCFMAVIEMDRNADYARLQLARLFFKLKQYENAVKEIEIVFSSQDGAQDRSLSVLLSFYELLMNDECKDLRNRYLDSQPEKFMKTFIYSLNSSFDQPYRILERLCKHLSYNVKECYAEICKMLPLPSNLKNNEALRIAYAKIQLAYFNLLKYSDNEEKIVNMEKAFELSEKYWLTTNLESEHNLKGILDLYIAAEKFDEALKYAGKLNVNPFTKQLLCKIFKGKKDYGLALQAVNEALDLSATFGVKNYHIAAFLHDKSEVLFELKDRSCMSELEAAIEKQDSAKTKDSWKKKLEDWIVYFN